MKALAGFVSALALCACAGGPGVWTVTRSSPCPAAPDSPGPVGQTAMCVNRPPVVNAGEDQVVDEGESVTLAGSAADLESGRLTYSWSRVGGPRVTLTGANTLTPTFAAPDVVGLERLTLLLTVDDGYQTGSDEVVITINDKGGDDRK